MFCQEFLFVFGNGSCFFVDEIVVDHYRAAFYTQPALLPCLVKNRKRLGSYFYYPGTNLNFMLIIELFYIIVVRVGHNERKIIFGQLQLRIKDFNQRVSCKFKPYNRYGIINMPQDVHISKAGRYGDCKHV